MTQWASTFRHALSRGIFPRQASFVLDLTLRNTLLSPRKLVVRLPLAAATHVLEVGAGSGFYSLEVARRMSSGLVARHGSWWTYTANFKKREAQRTTLLRPVN